MSKTVWVSDSDEWHWVVERAVFSSDEGWSKKIDKFFKEDPQIQPIFIEGLANNIIVWFSRKVKSKKNPMPGDMGL